MGFLSIFLLTLSVVFLLCERLIVAGGFVYVIAVVTLIVLTKAYAKCFENWVIVLEWLALSDQNIFCRLHASEFG